MNMLCLLVATLLCTVTNGSGGGLTSALSVLVTDQSGAVISGAEVRFKSDSMVITRTTTKLGRIVVKLPLDSYFVTVTSSGFETARISDFEARGSKMELKIVLHVGSSYSPLVIPSEAPVEPARLPELPLPER